MAAGLRLGYNRTYGDLGNIDIDLGDDLTFDVSDYKYLEHKYTAAGFLRTYLGLGSGKYSAFSMRCGLLMVLVRENHLRNR